MEKGYWTGIILGICFCGLITIIIVIENKRYKNRIEKIKYNDVLSICMSVKYEDQRNDTFAIEAAKHGTSESQYHNYESNNNFIVGTSYIYNVIDEKERVKIMLLYHKTPCNKYDTDFNIDEVYMSKEEFAAKKIKAGICVKTLHNTAPEVKFKIKEILDIE